MSPGWVARAMLVCGLLPIALGACAALPPGDRNEVEALTTQVQALEARLRVVEFRRDQIPAVVAQARGAVAFIWGTYTFIDAGGRPLRHVLDEAGEPVADAHGIPLVDLRGTGPIAVTQYTGTAFLAGHPGELITNRHVAEPWWENEASAPLLAAGLRPVFLRLRAFFQEQAEAVPIEVVRVDAEQDVALVRTVGWTPTAASLITDAPPPPVREGQPVLLIGYPMGLDAVLAKLDTPEVEKLEAVYGADEYALAGRLAATRRLRPTITGGFLWEALPHLLIYDAQTTGGGSGGPLLDVQGRVLGVNAAYLPDFRGGNYAVPVQFARALLAGEGLPVPGPARETPELCADSAAADCRGSGR